MKNCADIDALMTPYVDHEIDPTDRQHVDEHLAVCPPCRERTDAERAARRIVRARAATLVQAAPAALRARCVGVVPTFGAPAGRARVRSRVRRWVPLSMAATVLLAVGGVFMMGQQQRLEASFAAQMAKDHEKCFGEFGSGHPPLEPADAEALAAVHGVSVPVPAGHDPAHAEAGDAAIDLVDVRSCDYDGGHMAHLLYEVEGRPVSLFVIPDERHAERSLEVVGHHARLWSNDEAAYVLVGQEDPADMDRVVRYMRRYEEAE